MRIRLQLLLPLALGLLVGAAFVLVAASVGDAVDRSLATVAGLTRERAVEAAARAVLLAGAVATLVAVAVGAIVARMIVAPLTHVHQAAWAAGAASRPATPVAEIQDVARRIDRVAEELRDRTRQATRERAELAALVEAVSEGIVQLDGDGRIVRMNRAAQRLLGVPGEAVGRPVTAMVRHAELRRLLARAAAGEAVEPAEVVLDDRRVMITAGEQPDGGTVATVVDLTDLRRLEEVRRDFVANASHELKTPLTSIRGYTETLLAGDLPAEERRQFLETVARNAGRLQRIVDDLLDLSRVESGGWQPELEPVELLEAARTSWLGCVDRAASRGVTFAAAGDVGVTGMADRRALDHVFANLYDNALRYTPAGGSIRVRVGREEPRTDPPGRSGWHGGAVPAGGPWVVVDVIDTGSGIPRDALPRIFERFYRVDPARSREEGGTGLGLSIVRNMMERMGGAVTAQSELGRGTTLRLWIPPADGSGPLP